MHISCINDFSEKIFVTSKCGVWDYYVKIILQFYIMKGTKETWELMVFQKEILFRAIWLFCDKNDVTSS